MILVAHESKKIELLVILRGMQLCLAHDFSQIQVKSDCLLMVNLCNNANPIDSRFGIITAEIKKIQEHFELCTLSFIRRELNFSAHLLAHHA